LLTMRSFRKTDYLAFFALTFLFFLGRAAAPPARAVLGSFFNASLAALILGTVTNLVFGRRR